MMYEELFEKHKRYLEIKDKIPKSVIENYENDFAIRYTHESTAIEGNTLTSIEVKILLEDGITPGGKKLRELYEVNNHNKALKYVKKCISEGKPLNELIVKDIHAQLMEGMMVGGVYRNIAVRITGAKHKPPTPTDMYNQVKNFFADLPLKNDLNVIELAAWTHAEFVKIHPFSDGNGRTSRLMMNYQLMLKDFPHISIKQENRLEYYNVLEEYAIGGNIKPFADMIAKIEEAELDEYIELAEQSMGQDRQQVY